MFELVREDLLLFEKRLAVELESQVDFIQSIANDLVAAGGKRLRPSLSFLATRMLGASSEVGQTTALTVELLHSASLLHDDLIDGAETRRGREAAFRRYGNVVSVMSGDYILARVLRLLAHANSAPFTLLVSHTAAMVCEGEVLQHEMAALGNYSMATYDRVIEGKTGELMASALEGVAVLADEPEEVRAALRAFGMHYGRAFQLRDDYLDLLGDPGQLGKPVGGDLREGKATFPVLVLLERGSDEAREILERRAAREGDVERMASLAIAAGVPQLAGERIAAESRQAVEALTMFPDGEARKLLSRLADLEPERAI